MKTMNTSLKTGLLASLLILFPLFSWATGVQQKTTAMGIHGMLLFSDGEHLYASHLPMLHAPHNYQLILAIRFHDATLQRYYLDHGRSESYTIEPEKMDLMQVMRGPKTGINKFSATVYLGHFERGGVAEHRGMIDIMSVPLALEIAQPLSKSPGTQFLRFGEHQQFALHRISAIGDFDQIVRFAPGPPSITGTNFNTASAQALKLNEIVDGLQVVQQLWLETADFSE